MTINFAATRTAEHVCRGHRDKVADRISDLYQDAAYDAAIRIGFDPSTVRTAIEDLVKGDLVLVSGQTRAPSSVLKTLDVEAMVNEARHSAGYADRDDLRVIDHVQPQTAEIAAITGDEGAGDQGIMVGYASRETDSLMPLEYELARRLVRQLDELSSDGTLPSIRTDTKSQVSVLPNGRIGSVILSAQHLPSYALEALREDVFRHVVVPVVGEVPREIVRGHFGQPAFPWEAAR